MSELLNKVKANLILEHTADDALIERFITAAVPMRRAISISQKVTTQKIRCQPPRNRQ